LILETRGWSEERGATYRMRAKETSDDYRYFPEPDLPPLHLDPAWLVRLRSAMPELPAGRRARYQKEIGLSEYDASVLAADPDATALFEGARAANPSLAAKTVANWVTGEYLRLRNAAGEAVRVDPVQFAAIIGAVEDRSISRTNAKQVLEAHIETGRPAAEIIVERGYRQISDTGAVADAVEAALAANPAAVADYRAGKDQAVGFLVGQVMKATRGQADAALVGTEVRRRLDEPVE
jgi:aspartyl-tRNA(Asn)/glutamyl-tRNA(Gln) amidotransferase subunit B